MSIHKRPESKKQSRSRRQPTLRLRKITRLPKLPPRKKDAHKGDFGRVLIIGGSRGMIGAPALAANAALRAGAGLVIVAAPRSVQLAVATLCPCATSIPLPEGPDGLIVPHMALETLRAHRLLDAGGAPSVAAIGPGLGRSDRRFDAQLVSLISAFGAANVPVVLDADALHAIRMVGDDARAGWDNVRHYRTILTPHTGEMARLHAVSRAAVDQDRLGFAVRTAREMSGGSEFPQHQIVVVLKGAGTLVTDGASLYVNRTGNPGMATGGTGDVLTGVIAALVAQGLSTLDAAALGVHLHGLAGDLAARELGRVALIATDLIDLLPAALQKSGMK
jgi:NAD(P)H-hydrate epimerase